MFSVAFASSMLNKNLPIVLRYMYLCRLVETCCYLDKPVLAKIISSLPDKMSGKPSMLCRTFLFPAGHFFQFMVSKYIWQFLSPMPDIFHVLKPAGQNVRQCQSPLLDISRSLPDMSGIFREDWTSSYICLYAEFICQFYKKQ